LELWLPHGHVDAGCWGEEITMLVNQVIRFFRIFKIFLLLPFFFLPSPFTFPLVIIMLAAVKKGDVKKLTQLRQDPGFKVNMDQDEFESTLLHSACIESQRSAVIPLLLAHPGIDVNMKDKSGFTPFCWACANGDTSCVREMLQDSRVKVNEPAKDGHTPLWWAMEPRNLTRQAAKIEGGHVFFLLLYSQSKILSFNIKKQRPLPFSSPPPSSVPKRPPQSVERKKERKKKQKKTHPLLPSRTKSLQKVKKTRKIERC